MVFQSIMEMPVFWCWQVKKGSGKLIIENQMWFFWKVVIAIIQKVGSYSTIWLKFCLSHCKIAFIKHHVIRQKLYSIKFSLSFYILDLLCYLLKNIYMIEILLKPFWVLLHHHSWLRLHEHALFYVTSPIYCILSLGIMVSSFLWGSFLATLLCSLFPHTDTGLNLPFYWY